MDSVEQEAVEDLEELTQGMENMEVKCLGSMPSGGGHEGRGGGGQHQHQGKFGNNRGRGRGRGNGQRGAARGGRGHAGATGGRGKGAVAAPPGNRTIMTNEGTPLKWFIFRAHLDFELMNTDIELFQTVLNLSLQEISAAKLPAGQSSPVFPDALDGLLNGSRYPLRQVGNNFRFRVDAKGVVTLYGMVNNQAAEQQFVQNLHANTFAGSTTYQHINLTMKDVSREGAYELLRERERGWEYYGRLADTGIRTLFVNAVNGLQRVFKDVVWQSKESLTEVRKRDAKQYDALRLLDATLKCEEMTTEGGKQNSQSKLWTQNTNNNLQDCVLTVRRLLETLLHHFYRRQCFGGEHPMNMLCNVDDSHLPPQADRWNMIGSVAKRLMRTTGPVQWSGHGTRNHYKKTVITCTMMLELVVGLHQILCNLLVGFDGRTLENIMDSLHTTMTEVVVRPYRERLPAVVASVNREGCYVRASTAPQQWRDGDGTQVYQIPYWLEHSSLTDEHQHLLRQQ